MLRSSNSGYSSVGDKISSVPKGTAAMAVQYREDTAGTSGETNFSGVHKEAVQPEASVLVPLASPSPTDAQNISCKQDPARQLTRFSREKIKILVKIKKISSPTQQGAVTSL